jgi:hypothetical protein
MRTALTFTLQCGCGNGNGFSGKSNGNAPVLHIGRAEFVHLDDVPGCGGSAVRSAIPAAIHRPPDSIGARPAP